MHLLTIGLNHKTAPLELREQLAFSSSSLCALLDERSQQQSLAQTRASAAELHESVILSTCNRLEYYALAPNPRTATEKIVELIGQARQTAPDVFRPHLYQLQDEATINHLMQVATGLDSMVLGEAQILGQIVEAYQLAQAHHATGTILSRLFERAIHTGKRARTETNIGFNPASISSLAVRLARQHLGQLSDQVVMVLGAGEMGGLTVKSLVKQGVKELLIVNRTKENAEALAAPWQATAVTFDQLETGLRQADLVISSTAAPHTVLQHHQVAQAMQSRPDRPLVIIDIALPRDVETGVEQIAGVHLYNLDDLQSQVADNLQARQNEIPKVEGIIAEEVDEFMRWYHSLKVVPTITTFRRQMDEIRDQELQRTLNRLDGLDEREQEIVAELSHRLLNKFLHHPTVRLRAAAANGNGIRYTTALHELFALETDH